MDGVHDLGGMHGFGRVDREPDEPPFHAPWEGAVVAVMRASGAAGVFNIDEFRHSIERMEPDRYLASTYYERWLDGVARLLVEKGVVTAADLEARTAFFRARAGASADDALSAPPPPGALSPRRGAETFFRPATAPPRFAVGDRVRTRNGRARGHTRLPRYARDKAGVVAALRGVCVFPDTNAHGRGEQPEPVYGVGFAARELWGDTAEPNQQVFIDLWESYLEPDARRG
ncbi:MAG TPA: nitrile hydratase subunit beta [Candidatus Binatia bacterium]|nr:nitrile hydratase subunit beta [Candidatus Binatia bacterium]